MKGIKVTSLKLVTVFSLFQRTEMKNMSVTLHERRLKLERSSLFKE